MFAPGKGSQYYCEVCKCGISGLDQYHLHLAGEQHRKRAQGETGQHYHCSLCDVKLSGEGSRESHERGRMHTRRLAEHYSSTGISILKRNRDESPVSTTFSSEPAQAAVTVSGSSEGSGSQVQREASAVALPSTIEDLPVYEDVGEISAMTNIVGAGGGVNVELPPETTAETTAPSAGGKPSLADIASRLHQIATKVAAGEYGAAPVVHVKIVATRYGGGNGGSGRRKPVPLLRITEEELYQSASDNEVDAA